jgi:hypothetical protein
LLQASALQALHVLQQHAAHFDRVGNRSGGFWRGSDGYTCRSCHV